MSKEKQTIKAMAKDLCDIQYKGMKCRICYGGCECHMLAEALYNAGYLKQSEGEWIFHKDGSATCNQCNTTQKHIWDMDNYQSYCGHCGAKMKGGAE